MPDPLLTIAEAARITGLTSKAISSRIERKSLPSTMVDGKRAVRRRDLVGAGLLDDAAAGDNGPLRSRARVERRDDAAPPRVSIDVNALFARNERLMEELATHRVLSAQSQSTALEEVRAREAAEAALHEARAEALAERARREHLQAERDQLAADLAAARIEKVGEGDIRPSIWKRWGFGS